MAVAFTSNDMKIVLTDDLADNPASCVLVVLHLFKTAVPFRGQTTQILPGLPPSDTAELGGLSSVLLPFRSSVNMFDNALLIKVREP